MAHKFPNRGFVYLADGYWDADHMQGFPGHGITYMDTVMTKWYDVASADPSAVMIATFIWGDAAIDPKQTDSRYFPPSVLAEHTRIGRLITGRARKNLSGPVGSFEALSRTGVANGWACDPDGAWGETVLLDFYADGTWVGSTRADQADAVTNPSCPNGLYHHFTAQLSGLGIRNVAVVHDLDLGNLTLSPPAGTVSVAWVKPSSASWGPANTLTVAGYTSGGAGPVQMVWRDVSVNGPWKTVAYQAPTAADGTWSNTIPTSNYCHDYAVYANYSGSTSVTYTYRGLTSGYCNEHARVIWIQPASLAGFGPAGTLTVAGSATGAPAGTGVVMWWRDVTAGGAWTQVAYAAPTDANGIWYNTVPNANNYHQYAVYAVNDVVKSATCTYAGNAGKTNCP